MSHCRKFIEQPVCRREMLLRCANGFGGLALAGLFGETVSAGKTSSDKNPFAPKEPHFAPKAKSVIYLYMDGGPSQVDTFDPKPALDKHDGKDPHSVLKVEPTQFDAVGKVMRSPWKFKQHGESGLPVSSLFPHIATHMDDLCVINSMVAQFPEHTNANYFLHTGHGIQGRPSMGAWASYGLGSENQDLPGFVVLNGGLIPPGGLDCFNSGFLPATHQGSIFKPSNPPVANIKRAEQNSQLQRNKLALMRNLDAGTLDRVGRVDSLESAIANYELAYRMQMAVPELMDLSGETPATQQMYGMDHDFKQTQIFAAQCLIARRLVERGVRFIELTCPNVGNDRWDQHRNLKEGHEKNALVVDQPIAALLSDLKARGMLDETLVVWSGEFGRTPFAQGKNGRDHNPQGFSLWMAGGGIQGGIRYGATDEFGYHAVENRVEIYDLHATMLHLLGMNHEKLTFRFSGRDMRLTDVHGHVLHDILA
ncbi:hypothetical protein Pan258_60760 [Symmachiella dynata]|uniref:DUF1501 domain-containing protein n=1 Tax=Symmachiella dynata TaxID=2527995 RepID=UPI00118C52D3|nr:DUF1501 domain-containing protein [Symmachiella dynata]QDT51979.1 hypothetical protein Pan258_60760 [Symmachiella dynata]